VTCHVNRAVERLGWVGDVKRGGGSPAGTLSHFRLPWSSPSLWTSSSSPLPCTSFVTWRSRAVGLASANTKDGGGGVLTSGPGDVPSGREV
jgi:hypothetical protein